MFTLKRPVILHHWPSGAFVQPLPVSENLFQPSPVSENCFNYCQSVRKHPSAPIDGHGDDYFLPMVMIISFYDGDDEVLQVVGSWIPWSLGPRAV